MKRLSYIIAVILSFLVIYSGAGVSIIHYCCTGCETVKSCCEEDGCHKYSKKSHDCEPKKNCKEEGCTVTIYKLDLMKQTSELTGSVSMLTLFCKQYCYLLTVPEADRVTDDSNLPTPSPPCPRQMLAMHSVFLI